jgi:polyphosphate kinase
MLAKKYIINATIGRDLSWLAFNNRVLQEANDPNNKLSERLKFLGIFSNNLDEFYRVRVATLKKMLGIKQSKLLIHFENNPSEILSDIKAEVLMQQSAFEKVYFAIVKEMASKNIIIKKHNNLNTAEKKFIAAYFNENIRKHIVPLMLQSNKTAPILSDTNIYLACSLYKSDDKLKPTYALIEIPADATNRFIILPELNNKKNIILLEDAIKQCLPLLFQQFGYTHYDAHIIKVTRDADLDVDNELNENLITALEKGLKNRKKGNPTRFVFDKNLDKTYLNFLIKRLQLSNQDAILPGGAIHNFKDFIHFPKHIFNKNDVFKNSSNAIHPLLKQPCLIMGVLQKQDVMLHLPYHSFESVIDLLREASIDADVTRIQITAYRLAKNSTIINTLVNAVRNGKKVTVILELRARFDEKANLRWKQYLEDEGVQVISGQPNCKVHAKLCLITKVIKNKPSYYGFVSTGNLNETTASLYGDHCYLTGNQKILLEVKKVFTYFEKSKPLSLLPKSHVLITSPLHTRHFIINKINTEINNFKKKLPSGAIIKLNSISDTIIIKKLEEAAKIGVPIQLIVRGIFCAKTTFEKNKNSIKAISIIDSYLEHARVFIFTNNNKPTTYISSADWMRRNLDHRIETTLHITDASICAELHQILQIQLADNVKARVLNNNLDNNYVPHFGKKIQAQLAIKNYLSSIKY